MCNSTLTVTTTTAGTITCVACGHDWRKLLLCPNSHLLRTNCTNDEETLCVIIC